MSDKRDAGADMAVCDAATEGPWEIRSPNGRPGVWMKGSRCKVASVEAPDLPPVLERNGRYKNARFIALAREALPYWIRRAQDAEARFTAPIVCMCGSSRFKRAWLSEGARLSGEGNIVLYMVLWDYSERQDPDYETKCRYDELHKRKIDLCDWVWVLDVGGYIGDSTRSEIEYAEKLGKPVRYLSKEYPGYQEPPDPLKQAQAALTEAEAREAGLRDALKRAGEALLDPPYYSVLPDWITNALSQPSPVADPVLIHLYECGHVWRKENGECPESCPVCEAEQREAGLRDALIQAKGALILDHMIDDNGEPFGTTQVALEVIEQALSQPSPGVEKWRALIDAARDSLKCKWDTCPSLGCEPLCMRHGDCHREVLRIAMEGVSGE